ncbi:amino acid adenylation domain-containing protein [Micromonospora sp. NPDC047557]|uniref:amino acid adenylation domain-containing protein n=1 Tax=Micromonospora sp. NPDC047557 TaxID=3364250 RepID=UPI003710F73C
MNQDHEGFHPLAERVAARATTDPGAVAVVDGDRRWSYGELQEAADAVARQVIASGAGPERMIAVVATRSAESIATMLGVWRAGAVAVPLDARQPPETLNRMLPAVPIAGIAVGKAPELRGVSHWIGDGNATGPEATPDRTAGFPVLSPDSAAYVVFTSGSTGGPKGIVGHHGGIANYFDDLDEHGTLTPADRVVQLTDPSYDASLRDTYYPLTAGATVVVAPDGGRDLEAAAALMRDASVSAVLALVPSLARELCRLSDALPAVRTVLLSGERLHRSDLSGLRRVFPSADLVNMYGPSEATLTTTAYRVPADGGPGDDVPIGGPIRGAEVRLLDPLLRPVPAGLAGEIYIAGNGVSRGYWNRPGRTAAVFLPDPRVPGGRMYRTGDRARRRSDGTLQFLGRTDDQVKIRGHRVEPGEVERALREVVGVREAVCLAETAGTGDVTLVAYLTPVDPRRPPEAAGLRRELARTLPQAALPTAYLVVTELPRTAGGKVDRRALPAITPLPAPAAPIQPPRTPDEAAVAAIWSELLGDVEFAVDQSFFDLGGHSLLAMRLAGRIGAAFGVRFPVRTIFDAPTVEAQAEAVRRLPAGHDAARIVAPPGPAHRLSPAQKRVWKICRAVPDSSGYHVSGVFRISGRLEPELLDRAFTHLSRRHDAFRTSFPVVDGEPRAFVGEPSEIRVPVDHLGDAAPDDQVSRWVRSVAGTGFDLEKGPLLRVRLLRTGDTEHVLCVVVHHIVFDGASMGVLHRELVAALAAYRGQGDLPRSVPRPFAEIADERAAAAAGPEGAAAAAFWRARIDPEARLIPDLPDGYPFLNPADGERRVRSMVLDAAATARLAAYAGAHGCTPPMVLCAAYAHALAKSCGRTRFTVAMPVTGRQAPETRDTIGYLAGTVLVPVDMAGHDWPGLLEQVRGRMLDAYEQVDVPLESLAPSALTPELSLAQALFNVQEIVEVESARPGFDIVAADLEAPRSRHPLALYVYLRGPDIHMSFVCDAARFSDRWTGVFVTSVRQALDDAFGATSPTTSRAGSR